MKHEPSPALAKRYDAPRQAGRKPYSFGNLLIYTVLLALFSGFGSALWMLNGAFPFGREKAGAWLYWPDIGSANADPYAQAVINRDALLPLGVSEGIELLAMRDTEGMPLRAECSYRLGTAMPHARFWTLGTYRDRGSMIGPDVNRFAFTSREIVRNEDGGFTIALSRDIEPGNWLPLSGSGNFVLVLRLYDVPANGERTTIDPRLLPKIEPVGCQS